jgi:aldehyde:ferredoxin oxidoreductase
MKELPAHVDPLSPQNLLVIASGVLTGCPIPGSTRFTAAGRSPLTGGYGESEAGGYFGPELKFAGFDGLVISGKADHPVYLSICDEKVELHDARHLWGKLPAEVQQTVRAELGDERLCVLQTGPGGEKLVRYAGLSHNMRHYNGRTGMGAVMGSKNLKAIAVRGSKRYKDLAYDFAALSRLGGRLAKGVKDSPAAWLLHERGTPAGGSALNVSGMLPTRNFRNGTFEGVERIQWEAYESEISRGASTCYSCAIRCKREINVDDRYRVSNVYGGPEYEAIAGFGSNCGVADIQAVARANELCNFYIIDTISTSVVISFAMECFENGLLTLEDTDGLDLRFGNADAMLQMVEKIARREGLGDLLADGALQAAKKIGKGAEAFAMQVKGMELPMHDPRGKVGVGIGFAVSETGADHLTSVYDTMLTNPETYVFKAARSLGVTQALNAFDLSPEKVHNYLVFENWSSAGKCIGACYFGPIPRSFILCEDIIEALRAATGWDITLDELQQVGERATNLARLFNLREGFTSGDDTLPERLFTPLEDGVLKGIGIPKDQFEAAMSELYRQKGWDAQTGAPGVEKLKELGIGWAREALT